jgi:hypothetical protein
VVNISWQILNPKVMKILKAIPKTTAPFYEKIVFCLSYVDHFDIRTQALEGI